MVMEGGRLFKTKSSRALLVIVITEGLVLLSLCVDRTIQNGAERVAHSEARLNTLFKQQGATARQIEALLRQVRSLDDKVAELTKERDKIRRYRSVESHAGILPPMNY